MHKVIRFSNQGKHAAATLQKLLRKSQNFRRCKAVSFSRATCCRLHRAPFIM